MVDSQPAGGLLSPHTYTHARNSTMEAVGFAASICSLLELSEMVITYIKDAKGANGERNTLIGELAGTKAILSELESKADADEWRATMEALMTKNGPRDQFDRVGSS